MQIDFDNDFDFDCILGAFTWAGFPLSKIYEYSIIGKITSGGTGLGEQ